MFSLDDIIYLNDMQAVNMIKKSCELRKMMYLKHSPKCGATLTMNLLKSFVFKLSYRVVNSLWPNDPQNKYVNIESSSFLLFLITHFFYREKY